MVIAMKIAYTSAKGIAHSTLVPGGSTTTIKTCIKNIWNISSKTKTTLAMALYIIAPHCVAYSYEVFVVCFVTGPVDAAGTY